MSDWTLVKALQFPATLGCGCRPGKCAFEFKLWLKYPGASCWLPGQRPCLPLDLTGSHPAPGGSPSPSPLPQSLQDNWIIGCRESKERDCFGQKWAPTKPSPRGPGWPQNSRPPSACLARYEDDQFFRQGPKGSLSWWSIVWAPGGPCSGLCVCHLALPPPTPQNTQRKQILQLPSRLCRGQCAGMAPPSHA